MFLSKQPSGVYYLFFRDDLGKRRVVSTRARYKTEALKFLQTFREQAQQRRERMRRVSLSEFARTFLEHSRSIHTPKTVESNESALREFERILGDVPLHKIGAREVELFLAKKREEASVWTARKYYLALAACFEVGKRWGHVQNNPFRSVQKPKAPEVLPVFLSRADLKQLLGVIGDPDFRELVSCGVQTGMRRGELLALRWGDVDLTRMVITVRCSDLFTPKSKKTRVIPMTGNLADMLRKRRERLTSETGLVFHEAGAPLSEDWVSKQFKRYVLAAGLDRRLHFHSLRHSFGSWLAQDGVSLYLIQRLLGHSSSTTTQVYSHVAPQELHSVVGRIELPVN